MRTLTARTRLGAVMIGLALVLAACGADADQEGADAGQGQVRGTPDEPSDPPTEEEEEESSEEDPEPPEEEPSEEEPSEEEPEPSHEQPSVDPPPVVVASPLDIPLPINVLSGSIYADRIGEIEELVRQACGGDLCLTIVKRGQPPLDGGEPTLSEGDTCDRIDTVEGTVFDEQGQGHLVVDRDGELIVIVNVRCEDVAVTPGTDGTTTTGSSG